MPIKVMDGFGGGLNSDIGAAVIYAVDRGARVINLSVGTKGRSLLHQDVVDYARSRGVVLVAAAGNEGENVDTYTPAGARGVLSVAALDQNDKKPAFGNWGQNVSIAAPGVDIVSWRARASDFVLVVTGGKDYKAGDNIMAGDRWLYRASGTSFAAPFVAGAAALLFALNPNLTGRQVERMLVESADDVEVPGWDQITGAGRLNIARAALSNPNVSRRQGRAHRARTGGRPARGSGVRHRRRHAAQELSGAAGPGRITQQLEDGGGAGGQGGGGRPARRFPPARDYCPRQMERAGRRPGHRGPDPRGARQP